MSCRSQGPGWTKTPFYIGNSVSDIELFPSSFTSRRHSSLNCSTVPGLANRLFALFVIDIYHDLDGKHRARTMIRQICSQRTVHVVRSGFVFFSVPEPANPGRFYEIFDSGLSHERHHAFGPLESCLA
jgi:hypothetical protein